MGHPHLSRYAPIFLVALLSGCLDPEAEEADTGGDVIAAPAHFVHPGVLVNAGQLDFVRDKIAAGAQPWKGAYDKMRTSRYGKLNYQPHPRANVECGSQSNPNHGCTEEREDAIAAYTHALLWNMNGNAAHAEKAIEILDAWSGSIEEHTGSNAPLQTGWAGSIFPAAAELILHTYDGWSASRVDRFREMMRDVYLPVVRKGRATSNGNWELIMTEATMNIAVFLEDKGAFDKAVELWRRRVPAYIYLTSDGDYPKAATSAHNTRAKIIHYWFDQETFVDGIAQETCRDLGHTQWGIAAALAAAETAYQQGIDLYGEQSLRLRKGMEFLHDYELGKPVPSWLCGGDLQLSSNPTAEIGFNHFRNRLGIQMPRTIEWVQQKVRTRSNPTDDHFIAWETLTHAKVFDAGL
jgi:alginate lyase